jgi:hypothetical protein
MIRNLFYAIFLHFILFLIIYFSYISIFNKSIKLKAHYINFVSKTDVDFKSISPRTIEDIKNNIAKKRKAKKYRDLSLAEKLELYKEVKANKQEILNNDFKNKIKDKPLENIFYYIESPLYIARHTLSDKEFEQIQKNNEIKKIIKEEIKFHKKEQLLVNDRNKMSYTDQELIEIAQKPVVIKNKKTLKKFVINDIDEIDFAKISEILFNDKRFSMIKLKFSDEEIQNIKPNEIFTKKDVDKLVKGYELNKEVEEYRLTAAEQANIQRQIKKCFQKAIIQSNSDNNIVINVTVRIDKNGYIDMNAIKILDSGIYKNAKEYRMATDNVKTALVFCNPLKNLPMKKYITWNEITLTFDSRN